MCKAKDATYANAMRIFLPFSLERLVLELNSVVQFLLIEAQARLEERLSMMLESWQKKLEHRELYFAHPVQTIKDY